MKKTLFIIALAFTLLGVQSCGGEKKETPKESSTEYRETKVTRFDDVYVCTGRYAKRFHCDEDCKGLQSCRGGIVVMSIEEAEDYGLTPCGYCY